MPSQDLIVLAVILATIVIGVLLMVAIAVHRDMRDQAEQVVRYADEALSCLRDPNTRVQGLADSLARKSVDAFSRMPKWRRHVYLAKARQERDHSKVQRQAFEEEREEQTQALLEKLRYRP